MLDELVLALQGLVDRIARWARLGPTDDNPRRRFLIVQIDGLSKEVFEGALHTGGIPNTARLIASRRFLRRPMSVGLPSSTPAFQAAAMYGVMPDIPGFHYYDKRAERELHFPEAGDADFVETRVAAGRRGILEGGSCYGCVFTGGAENSLLTFARLMKVTRAGLPLLRLALSVVLLGWVIAKCLWLTAVELTRFVVRLTAHPDSASHDGLRWLGLKIVFSIWVRELFTLSVSADLYRGIPALYVNFLDYDVFAHSFGPTHRSAMRALRHIDNAIGQLARIVERLPEFQYDLYILADHGQTMTRPFPQVSGGQSLEEVTRDILGTQSGRADNRRRAHMGVARQLAGYRQLITDAEQPLGISIRFAAEESSCGIGRAAGGGRISVPNIMAGRRNFGIDRPYQTFAVGIRQYERSDAGYVVDRTPRRLALGVSLFLLDIVAPPHARPRTQGRKRRVGRKLLGDAGILVTNSGFTRELTLRTLGALDLPVLPDRVVTVPLGTDPARFRPDIDPGPARAHFGIPDGRLLLTVARLTPHKGIDTSLRVLARLLPRFPDLRYVVAGQGVGSKQTVPTLNLKTAAEILPAVGVYITRTRDLQGEARWNSITNIGYRPTFDGQELTSETFLFGALERPPARIRVEFLRRVRDERKFENPEALKAQILRDVGRAQAYFRRLEALGI